MTKNSEAGLLPTRFMLECAPMGKFKRVIYEFAFKKHLPAWFGLWAIISIPIALFLAAGLSMSFAKFYLASSAGSYFTMVMLPFLLLLIKPLLRPTHILVTQDGVARCWRRTLTFYGKTLAWSEIHEIKVMQPVNTSRVQSRLLVFYGASRKIELKIDEIVDVSMLPAIYEMIAAKAAGVPRDPELQSMLGADRANSSYTELWLKALTAPPERSRLVPLEEGTQLQSGEYTVREKIGAGGQGIAYTAMRRGHEEIVVLKEYVLPVGVNHSNKVDSLEKFQREAQILSQVNHDQIVKLLDFFFEDHRGYMVLEYVAGASLNSMVQKSGPMAEAQVLDLAKQMASVLSYLHTREPAIIHRDFTPDNIILTTSGKLKLIDFNVAQQKKTTATATVVGKHAYIAPDQFRGKVSPQSDIYSLGATLYFLLTGSDPKPISVLHPREKNSSISQELDAIVATCTALDPALRYPDANKLAEALDGLLAVSGATEKQ